MAGAHGQVIRVGVIGATGRMGQTVCAALLERPGFELAAAVGRRGVGADVGRLLGRGTTGVVVSDRLEALAEAGADVAAEFTSAEAAVGHARWCARQGVPVVIGTTGLTPDQMEDIHALADDGAHVLVAPNLSLTGALMLHVCAIAARHLDEVEVLEVHPPHKADAPSGTSLALARAMAAARDGRPGSPSQSRELTAGALGALVDGIRVHALRLTGAIGVEEVRFAHRGDILNVSVVNADRRSYAAGALLAAQAVRERPGLTLGLAPVLGLGAGA